LHDALAAAGGGRVVSVSSVGHLNGQVVFEDIHFEWRPYDPRVASGQSKTANTRWASDGITVNALTPGRIRTNLMGYVGDEQSAGIRCVRAA
jgi:NAD(P)-dependent dehydrogenase (short-subunit alcohol dehydrogenase family)